MARMICDLMNPDVISLPGSTSVVDAARRMRDGDVGDVLVVDDGAVRGMLTDRDIVVRGLAWDCDPQQTTIEQLCTPAVFSVSSSDDVDVAMALMRDCAIRRVPVIDDGVPVGMITLGDVVVNHDRGSVLADISGAEPNH